LEDPSQISGDNPKILKRENIKILWKKKAEYLKDKINKLETNNKKYRDLYVGINEFNKGYQPRINIIWDENV
jgi:hypothetical protein